MTFGPLDTADVDARDEGSRLSGSPPGARARITQLSLCPSHYRPQMSHSLFINYLSGGQDSF